MRRTIMLAALLALAGVHAAGDTLTLRQEAFVKGPKVLLGEVADIEGANASSLAAVDLGSAPQPGQSRQLNAALVESRLRTAGLTEVSVKGAASVRATTLHAEVTPDMVAESLRMFIQSQMPWKSDNTEIDIKPPTDQILVPDGQVCFTWRANPQYAYLGQGAFQGTVSVDGRSQTTVTCKATIESYASVVVAANDIPRGKPLIPGLLESRRLPVSGLPHGAATSIEDLIGRVASKTIFPGQIITTRNVEMPILVHRRQSVPVELESGTVHVQTQGVALMDGRVGDVIACGNVMSQEQFQGVVRQDGVVVVR